MMDRSGHRPLPAAANGRRPARALLLALASAMALTGCGERTTPVDIGDREGIFLWGNGSEPADLCPQTTTGLPEHHIHAALFEGLTDYHPETAEPVPAGAVSWDISEDGRVYTFHLRKEARWSNGDPVTATDYVFSFRRMLSPKLATEYAYMLFALENAKAYNQGEIDDPALVGAEAVDEHTLRLTLHSPTAHLPAVMCHNSWFAVHRATIEAHGRVDQRGTRWTRPGNHVGNGAFRLKSWKVRDRVVVVKNPHYWDAANVSLNEVHFLPIDNYNTEERAFRAGQLHITDTIPQQKIPVYRKRYPDNSGPALIAPWAGTYYYIFNTEEAAMADKRVRRALTYAIDRKAIIDSIARGSQLPALYFTPPNTGGYTSETRFEEDVEEARRLLAEAGYPGGEGFPKIGLLYNTSEVHRPIAEAVQEMWRKNLNIDVILDNQEWKVYLDTRKQGNFQVVRAGWIGDYNDANNFLDLWLSYGGNNHANWKNERYDELIEGAGRTGDQAERFRLFQEAEALLLDEMPVLPIYFYVSLTLKQPSVVGWHPNILDQHPLKHLSLDPTRAY